MTPTNTEAASGLQQALDRIVRLLSTRRTLEARQQAQTACHTWPNRPELWLAVAQVEKQAGDFWAMLRAVERALRLKESFAVRCLYIEALSFCGRNDAAIKAVSALNPTAGDAGAWRRVADLYTHLLQHRQAAVCIEQALKVSGETQENLIARANSDLVLGYLQRTEKALDKVIHKAPNTYEAYYTRSTLRRQTTASNHIDELQAAIDQAPAHPAAQVPLRYALAKELEDLEDWQGSFEQLTLGARARRRVMPYRVETDLKIIDRIIETFDDDYFTRRPEGCHDAAPLFVLGLPRSGTTLVDRILGCSPSVVSLGEINDFSLAAMRLAGPAASALERVSRSRSIDVKALGAAYCEAMAGYGAQAPHLIDKTPFNTLNIGLIAAALPKARIIHIQRHPVANAYGAYRTLFRLGYPWSYSLDDIGRYMVAHHRLMTHWKNMLGNRLIGIDYEALVDRQEETSRSVYERCGLEWTEACLSFHKNGAPVCTASAVQVRQPLYKSAVARWQYYERQLAPVAACFKAHNLPLT